ncbi:MAG: hypothetical protein CMK59_08150 [Proteobacteria bacterium]|nr:hypothetical protein [Pseudomonadota bacterium]
MPDFKTFVEKYSLPQEALEELELISNQTAVSNTLSEQLERTLIERTSVALSSLTQRASSSKVPIEAPSLDEDRYRWEHKLGVGAMGEVYRVFDQNLMRHVALKTIHKQFIEDYEIEYRFIEEAQIASQLQHPNIIPIYDIGRLPDGRLFFTMQELRGRSLRKMLSESSVTLRRYIEIFFQVCSAISYTHEHEILHRDLKPANIMIGEHDSVQVVDWGLAKNLATVSELTNPKIQTIRESIYETAYGSITGTPAYMSPEQSDGVSTLSVESEVYTLGMILLTILLKENPFKGCSVSYTLEQLQKKIPLSVKLLTEKHNVDELWNQPCKPLLDICVKALQIQPEDRYRSVQPMLSAIQGWMDGEEQKHKAQELSSSAKKRIYEADRLEIIGLKQRAQSRSILLGLEPWEQGEQRQKGILLQELAEQNLHSGEILKSEAEAQLMASLSYSPRFTQAHILMAQQLQKKHKRAERERKYKKAETISILLQHHMDKIPAKRKEKSKLEHYLKGHGAITVDTHPSGAEVHLEQYIEKDRIFLPVAHGVVAKTPLINHTLPMGSYRLTFRKEGFEDVRYPVQINREQHWNSIPPNSTDSVPIVLPKKGSLKEDEAYIPAGWFWQGGDEEAYSPQQGKHVWLPAFIMKKTHVTIQTYISDLNDLIRQGQEQLAIELAPKTRGTIKSIDAMLFGRDEEGLFFLRPDEDGDLWNPQWPMIALYHQQASKYAQYRSVKDNKTWKLPSNSQWEKAARGSDGRFYVWGNLAEATWMNIEGSCPGQQFPSIAGSHTLDQSVYDILDLAGNVRDMTCDLTQSNTQYWARGSSWSTNIRSARCCSKVRYRMDSHFGNIGFRLVRPL